MAAEPHERGIQFPSLKARRMLRVLKRAPLRYTVARQVGSHRTLVSRNGYPQVRFSAHDKDTIGPDTVREILVKRVGLSEEEALGLL